MRKTGLVLALVGALLALGAGSAGAIEFFAFNPGGEISMVGPVTFTASETTIRCNVTLIGTLSRAVLRTTSGTAMGSISSGRVSECSGGSVSFLIPISINFVRLLVRTENEQIFGMLVRFTNFGVLIEESLGFRRCLFGPTVELLIAIEKINNEYVTARVTYLTGGIIELVRSLGFLGCPFEGRMSGTMELTPRQRVRFE